MILIYRDIIEREFVKKDIKRNFGYTLSLLFRAIRAETYELFKFNAQYISSDYEDIRNFLDTSYNLRHFHNSVNIEGFMRNREMKQNIKNFYALNNYLFPDDSETSLNDSRQCSNNPTLSFTMVTEELKKHGLLNDK